MTSNELMVRFMQMRQRMRISKGGQISIPAPIRHRWSTSTVTLLDQGDRLVIEPAADDPIAAADGAMKEYAHMDFALLRRRARDEDAHDLERKKQRP